MVKIDNEQTGPQNSGSAPKTIFIFSILLAAHCISCTLPRICLTQGFMVEHLVTAPGSECNPRLINGSSPQIGSRSEVK